MSEFGSFHPIEEEEKPQIGLPPYPTQKGTLPTGQTVSVSPTDRLAKLCEQVEKGAVLDTTPEGSLTAIEKENLTEEVKSRLGSQTHEEEISAKTISLFHEAFQSAATIEEIQTLDRVAQSFADNAVGAFSKEKFLTALPKQISKLRTLSLPTVSKEVSLGKAESCEKTTSKLVQWVEEHWDIILSHEWSPKVGGVGVCVPKGVKWYTDPEIGKVVVDIAQKFIGSGSSKWVKSVLRILPDHSKQKLGRYTPPQLEEGKDVKRFLREMTGFGRRVPGGELYWRKRLREGGEKIPETITDIHTITYTGKKGDKKTRYFSVEWPGDLWDLMQAEDIKSDQILDCLRDVLKALTFIHKKGIVHYDIKPDNILYNEDKGQVTDFGSATNAGSRPQGRGHTLGFAAPEIFFQKSVSSKADIFSFGVTLSLLIHHPTFDAYTNIRASEQKYVKKLSPTAQKKALQSLKGCIEYCRAQLFDEDDELQKLAIDCLSWDPEERPSSEEALARLEAILAKM